jgi:hypothetical protein
MDAVSKKTPYEGGGRYAQAIYPVALTEEERIMHEELSRQGKDQLV